MKTSRFSLAKQLKRPIYLPIIKNGYYLIKYLEEMGFCTNNGEKIIPITYTELNAWLQSTKLELSHNEITHIKKLSESFVNAFNESSRDGAKPYYSASGIETIQ